MRIIHCPFKKVKFILVGIELNKYKKPINAFNLYIVNWNCFNIMYYKIYLALS